ncbi:GNAT family N-acetyltransferase [Oxynema aestuarii]|uniref:GNAT family N-acetyltransferase n=1 Tax=Oxynema aestuarii AP17 TaxID=2064643 RepID=A0A6H1TYL0_9CYAN|nr:GNAT family N-acetyltransferase [Oxynema aestuarii]QIZ70449.1 GNAT family N-acetyltransferase [Oxynema aestuarii AP17]
MVKIVRRKVTSPEAQLLLKEIQKTPYIVGYSYKEWREAENIRVAEDSHGNLMGVSLNIDFGKNWTKIAVLYVREANRGRGIGKRLFYSAFEEAIARKRHVYTISSNPMVIKMMADLEFTTFSSLLNFPKAYQSERRLIYIHMLAWLANLYRIKEMMRKHWIYDEEEQFIYGIHRSSSR